MGDFVQISVTNPQNDVISFEKKFRKDLKIAELKVTQKKKSSYLNKSTFDFYRDDESIIHFCWYCTVSVCLCMMSDECGLFWKCLLYN